MGTILPVAFNFAPRGRALCNGQLLSISQYSALFALLGTSYGGDGVQKFGLPNLQGRVAVGQGNGAGLSPVVIGEASGADKATVVANGNVQIALTAANLPGHTHPATMNLGGVTAATTVNVDSTAMIVTDDYVAYRGIGASFDGGHATVVEGGSKWRRRSAENGDAG